MPESSSQNRHAYKDVWSKLSEQHDSAVAHVIGPVDEATIQEHGKITVSCLQSAFNNDLGDTILEIGCGIGRVGQQLAPICKKWIGCDVSPHMLQHSRERLKEFENVELVEISGYDLSPIPDNSVDLVYCTVVFMHLEEWDRYQYILEAMRVLKPGGRVYVDNMNLCSDEGWAFFEQHRSFAPDQRPAHISKTSTPQEIETYLQRAGYEQITIRVGAGWIHGYGRKPA